MPLPRHTPLSPRLWHDSGGLSYHWRALRYRKTLWAPFISQASAWLDSWQPPEEELVIVGPSAGYTLPAQWLARFRRISILEPDPLARWLLARRLPSTPIQSCNMDCFATADGPAQLRGFFPDSAILFSNVIGQIIDDTSGPWKHSLLESMQGISWASYHDVISTAIKPARTMPIMGAHGTPLEDILGCFWNGGELPLHDHGCYGLIPGDTAYAIWSITPDQHHLVGWNCITVV